MKKIISLIAAGFLGGAMAIFVGNYFSSPQMSNSFNQAPQAILASNTASQAPFDFVKAASLATPAVVGITVRESAEQASNRFNNTEVSPLERFFDMGNLGDRHRQKGGSGSGVVISSDGYIVTNNHVVEGGDIITVDLMGEEFSAKRIGTDPSTDIALIKIDANGLKTLGFANSDNIEVGEWVAAIGNPFSYLNSTVTAGIVSAKGRDIDLLQRENDRDDRSIEEFIQTDAAINPGNSGGALVNIEGELVGINTAIATPTGVYAGYGFAVPSNLVKRVVEDIKENGDIERGRLGIEGRTIDNVIVQENNLSRDKGFFVENLVVGSGAEKSGVLPGDIVTAANGNRVDTFEDLLDVVEIARLGDKIILDIVRKNKELKIPVYLRKGI